MKKKRSASSVPGKRAARSVKPIPDSEIDFSDIPETTDEELGRMRRVGRPKSGMAVATALGDITENGGQARQAVSNVDP